LGRDPSFFLYANGNVAEHLLPRVRHALIDLDPADNPYLHWILKGQHGNALPFALRRENFDAIRTNLDCIELRCQSLEDFLESTEPESINSFNLSDVFEYMPPDDFRLHLERLARCGKPGARLAYWNFLAKRHRPPELRHRLRPQIALARELFQQDKAFFYSDFVVEDVI
jgi:S-adenosylmethionine-diacylglycerol 3-amino-3-carboxypropyl transferase